MRTTRSVVDVDAPLMEAGVDSLGVVELSNQLQKATGCQSFPSTLILDHPTARKLANELQTDREQAVLTPITHMVMLTTRVGVVTDGASARLPTGASPNSAICAETCSFNAIAEVPFARWDVRTASSLP